MLVLFIGPTRGLSKLFFIVCESSEILDDMGSFRSSPSFLRTRDTLADDLSLATFVASGIANIRPATLVPGCPMVDGATTAPLPLPVIRDAAAADGRSTGHDGLLAAEVRHIRVGDITATSPSVRFRPSLALAADVRIAVLDPTLAAHVRLPGVGAAPAAVTRLDRRPVVDDTAATDLALLVVHLQRVTSTTAAAVRRVSEVLLATATVVRRDPLPQYTSAADVLESIVRLLATTFTILWYVVDGRSAAHVRTRVVFNGSTHCNKTANNYAYVYFDPILRTSTSVALYGCETWTSNARTDAKCC